VAPQHAERKVAVIGAALDLGAGRRGVDMGPSAIRYAGLAAKISDLGHEVVDWGNVETAVAEATVVGDEHARFLPQIKTTCERIAQLVARAARDGFVPVVLGGDHSVGLGTLAGLRAVNGLGGAIWIDAHGDLNSPETSPSGNVHGMVLAAASVWRANDSGRTVGVCRRWPRGASRSSGCERSTRVSGWCCATSTSGYSR
jgi:arginase